MRQTIEELVGTNQDVIRAFTGGKAREKRFPIDHQKLAKMEKLNKFMGKYDYTIDDVYKQILNKKCKLSAEMRKFVLSHFDDDGKLIGVHNES